MTTIEIIAASITGAGAAGAWLRWAVKPVLFAFWIGRTVGQRQAGVNHYGV